MKGTERVFNIALGLSVMSWALLGLMQPFSIPRLSISTLNATVGALLLLREPLVRSGSVRALALALPGVVVAGLALKLASPLELWKWPAQVLFCTGVIITIAAFIRLGQSFAILPALRTVISRGPYRFVRHPAYVGELLMVMACVVAAPSWLSLIAFSVALPLVGIRIIVEERLLRVDPSYIEYTETVRFRLVPYLW